MDIPVDGEKAIGEEKLERGGAREKERDGERRRKDGRVMKSVSRSTIS